MVHTILVKKEKWLSFVFYEPARREIKKDLSSILTKLQKGESVGGPDTQLRKSVAAGWELGILVFHGFKKKTQKTPVKEIDTGKTRLSALLKEL